MKVNRRPASSVGLALTALLAAAAPLSPAAQTDSSCPIPIDRQIEAVEAFSEMMPVFRHPRCLNCHGGMDPMSPAHPGAGQVEALPDFQEFIAQCQNCHDELPGWRQPGSPVFFVGKSDEELCLQMKQFEKTGHDFVEHIRIDHGPDNVQFIAAAFAGDRALGEGVNDYNPPIRIEKPPGTQADLTALATKWTDILGEGYESSPECGCKVKLELTLEHRAVTRRDTARALVGGPLYDGTVRLELKLDSLPTMAGVFYGQTTVVRQFSVGHITSQAAGQGTQTETWNINATVDSDTDTLHLGLGMSSLEMNAWWSGRGGRSEVTVPLRSEIGRRSSGPISMPFRSGSSQTFTLNGSAFQETLTVTIP